MAKIKILETLDAGADVLIVRGTVDGKPVEARGWLSAMSNHYDEKHYEEIPEPAPGKVHKGKCAGRHLRLDAKPRAMNATECRAYCERLLLAAVQPSPSAPAKVKLF